MGWEADIAYLADLALGLIRLQTDGARGRIKLERQSDLPSPDLVSNVTACNLVNAYTRRAR